MSVNKCMITHHDAKENHVVPSNLIVKIANGDVNKCLRVLLSACLRTLMDQYPHSDDFYEHYYTLTDHIIQFLTLNLYPACEKRKHKLFSQSNVLYEDIVLEGHPVVVGTFNIPKVIKDDAHHHIVGFEYELIDEDGNKFVKMCNSIFYSGCTLGEIYGQMINDFNKKDKTEENKEDDDVVDVDLAPTEIDSRVLITESER